MNKIDDLMQDITEQQDVAQEISDAISNRATFGDEFDEVSTSGLWSFYSIIILLCSALFLKKYGCEIPWF